MRLSDVVKQNGFANEEEFHRMVEQVDISSPSKLARFKEWQITDGTKKGLLKLPRKKEADDD